jgi:hypothetical protein
MAHLQNYAQQMGGFDFAFSQRYRFNHSGTLCLKKKKLSNRFPIKKQEPLLSE